MFSEYKDLELEKKFLKMKDIPEDYIINYKINWIDNKCIQENHNIIFKQPFGVIGICLNCKKVQSYDLYH